MMNGLRRLMRRSSFLRYNAKRCAASKSVRCCCQCGGKLHGQPHTEEWLALQLESMRARERARDRAESEAAGFMELFE
jgi:hypothetical protein